MVQFKAALLSLLVTLAVTSALPRVISDDGSDLEKQDVFPRALDPAKIERMRNRLGPQLHLNDNEANHNSSDDLNSKAPTSKDVINKKSNSPPPEIIKNSNSPQRVVPERKPTAPKRPLPPFPIKNDEFVLGESKEIYPSPKKGKGIKGSRGRPQEQQPDSNLDNNDGIEELKPTPKGKAPKQKLGGERKPASQQYPPSKRPTPEEVDGANQNSPQSRGPGKKQKPITEKPKLPSPGPSKFQNKKASKLAGPNYASGNGEQENRPTTIVPKKQPQVAPNISQGAPKDRIDGSKARKQAKSDGSRHRKQGEAEGNLPGSEGVAKDAIETSGAPKNRPGKLNNLKANNQATAKRPSPKPQSGVGEETIREPGARQSEKDAGYFKWFRTDEKRPVDYAKESKGDWMNEFPVTDDEALPPTPPSSPVGLEKLPINQRQREQEERDAVQGELDQQNKKAAERDNFF